MKNENVKTKKSQSGLGLFALRDFKKGEMIVEYTGEKITEEEANRRGGKYFHQPPQSRSLHELGQALPKLGRVDFTPRCQPRRAPCREWIDSGRAADGGNRQSPLAQR